MEEIRIILYLIITVVSVISLISYGSKKSKLKKSGKEVLEGLIPHRNLTESELDRIRAMYKKSIGSLSTESKVFKLEGSYTWNEIRTRYQTHRTHYINSVEIVWDEIFQFIISENNIGEIVINDKGVAILLNLNSDYSIEEPVGEVITSEKIEERKVTNDAKIVTRTLEPIEEEYLNRSNRVFNSLILAVSLIIYIVAGFDDDEAPYVIAGILLLLSLVLYLIPKKNKISGSVELLELSGEINLINGIYHIGRFPVHIDKSYTPEVGISVNAQAYSFNKEHSANWLLKDDYWSISKEYQFSGFKNRGRFTLLATILGLGLLINMIHIPRAVSEVLKYTRTYGLQSDFDSTHQIANFDFKNGQTVNLKGFKLINDPVEGTAYIVNSDFNYILTDKDVLIRLDALMSVQFTRLFLNLYALKNDSLDAYQVLYDTQKYNHLAEKYDFDHIFRSNKPYVELTTFWEKFLKGEEEPVYQVLLNNYWKFFEDEIYEINTLIYNDLIATLKRSDKVELLGDLYTSTNYLPVNLNDYIALKYKVGRKLEVSIPDNNEFKKIVEKGVNEKFYNHSHNNSYYQAYYDFQGRMGLRRGRLTLEVRHFAFMLLIVVSLILIVMVIYPGFRKEMT